MKTTVAHPENFTPAIPAGDDRERMICGTCGFVSYDNPRIIAGAVVTFGGKVLLCKRAIYPQKGRWTIPAGYLELGETPAEGAAREAWEEARAAIEIRDLLAVYTVRRISQVHMFYRAVLPEAVFEPGPESHEVALFDWADIPWDDLAFPNVHWVLGHYREADGKTGFAPYGNPEGWEHV